MSLPLLVSSTKSMIPRKPWLVLIEGLCISLCCPPVMGTHTVSLNSWNDFMYVCMYFYLQLGIFLFIIFRNGIKTISLLTLFTFLKMSIVYWCFANMKAANNAQPSRTSFLNGRKWLYIELKIRTHNMAFCIPTCLEVSLKETSLRMCIENS